MRNATVAALIYEFLFDVCRLMQLERPHIPRLHDEKGMLQEAFSHNFTSRWEWSTTVLEAVGALKSLASPHSDVSTARGRHLAVRSPFYYPVMSLDECRDTDFSAFETFDNYCYAMFTFSQFISGEYVDPAGVSPQFLEAVATKDDLFSIDRFYRIKFVEERFQEKVMTRWREMDVRAFQSKDSA